MNPDKIRFNCPSCGIQLDVPAALAGVTGPCPKCQSSITAPHPQAPEPTVAPAPQPQPQAPIQQQPAPQQNPATPTPIPAPQDYAEPALAPAQAAPRPESHPAAGQNVFPTVVPDPAPPEVHATPDEPPFPIEPEPVKQIPEQRSSDGHASSQPAESPEPRSSGTSTTPTKQGSRLPSIIFLILFLIAATAIVLGILNATGIVGIKSILGLEKKSPDIQMTLPPTTPSQPPALAPGAPAGETPAAISPPAEETLPEVEVEEPAPDQPAPRLPDGEDYREGETPLPQGLSINSDDPREVQKILESFLAAENLSTRQPFISTSNLDEAKLITSPLASGIPKPGSIFFLNLLKDQQEKRSDFFYAVSWDESGRTPVSSMAVELHQWPGSEPPRVHADAFLEFYQQKLRRYAAAPLDRPARFYVLAQCLAKCFETESVPDAANKATLKLSTIPNEANPVKAYFNKKGEMLEKLKSYRDGLAFRKEIPLTVTLEWSKSVDNLRYLELRIIDSFDWHP